MDPKVTRSTFTGVFLCALGSNPAVAVFPKVCSGSKGDAKHFYWCFFVCVGLESCCCSAFFACGFPWPALDLTRAAFW